MNAGDRGFRRRFVMQLEPSVFKEIFDSYDADLLLLEPREFRVVAANRAFLERRGLTLEQALGRHCHDFDNSRDGCMPPCELCPIAAAIQHGQPAVTEHRTIPTHGGEARHLEIKVVPIFDTAGQIRWLFHRTVDITEAVRIRERAITEERIQLVTFLLRKMGHRYLNQLVGLVQLADVLQREATTPAAREGLLTIRETVALVEQETRSLLRIGRLEPQHPEYVELSQIVRTVLADLRRYEMLGRCDLGLELESGAGAVIFGDREDFVEIVRNVAINALQSMESSDRARLRIALRLRQGRVCLTIEDCGGGIPSEHLARVFDPFFSTKSEHGSGLGLAIVKRLVEKYGGSLSLRSELRSGTTVEISLPTVELQPEVPSGLSS